MEVVRTLKIILSKYFSSIIKNFNLKKDPKTLAEFKEMC